MPEGEDLKIIMLTALSDEQIKQEAIRAGAHDFIVKSEAGMAEVLKRIDKVLSR
jgi:DNA-binding response OmpR family regulator